MRCPGPESVDQHAGGAPVEVVVDAGHTDADSVNVDHVRRAREAVDRAEASPGRRLTMRQAVQLLEMQCRQRFEACRPFFGEM